MAAVPPQIHTAPVAWADRGLCPPMRVGWLRIALTVPSAAANVAAPEPRPSGQEELMAGARPPTEPASGGQAGSSAGCQRRARGSCRCVKASCRFAHLAVAVQSVAVAPGHELPWPCPVLGSCPLSVLTLDTGEQTVIFSEN